MKQYYSYFNTAVSVLSSFDGTEPFSSYLKKYFAERKKYGSRDRKEIAHICYSSFRTGRAFPPDDFDNRIFCGLFLTSNKFHPLLKLQRPGWEEYAGRSFSEKAAITGISLERIFDFPSQQLSPGIEPASFYESFLIQPDLFVRIRPGFDEKVKQDLVNAGISFREIRNDALAFDNKTPVDKFIRINSEAVIQDLSSQKAGDLLKDIPSSSGLSLWDCCAASGGKSIMAIDRLGKVDLTVSDVRPSILANLKERLSAANISGFRMELVDLSQENAAATIYDEFDVVIADVPCSGSGTWSRTPEQLVYFDEQKIDHYAELQTAIVKNAWAKVKRGGYMLYITCSVFRNENEEQVKKINGDVIKMALIRGYDQKADTMFAALLKKS